MSFYGKVFNNLVSWIFKKGDKKVEMGPTTEEREINLGNGLELDENTRTISVTPCVLTGTIDNATLKLEIVQRTATNTTTQEEE